MVKIVTLASGFLDEDGLSVDSLHSFLGRLESVRPAVELAPLHYRSLQLLVRPFLRKPKVGQIFLSLSQGARSDLQWWIDFSLSRSTAPLTLSAMKGGGAIVTRAILFLKINIFCLPLKNLSPSVILAL